MNQTFDNGVDPILWTNYTTGNPTKFTVGHYNNPTGSNDSIYLKLNEDGGNWQDTSSLINYSFPLLRENIPYEDWYIKYSVKWIMTDNSWRDDLPSGSKYVMGLKFSYNDGSSTSREFNLKKPSEIMNNTWYHITMNELISPFPELYGYDPPANVSMYFSFGVKNAAYSPIGSLTIYYDNISFEIQSIPKPSTIDLKITDNAIGGLKNQPIQDFQNLFGKGNIFLEGNWSGEVGGSTHEFSFTSNSSGNVLINTNFHAIASSLGFTTTSIGTTGSDFTVENGSKVIWTMNIPISIPGSYSINYYFNVSKPLNWKVTQVLDPYSNNRITEVIGAGVGNSTLTVPNNIITNGVWKIVAEAPNYVELAHLFRKEASAWNVNNTFYIHDRLKINASINTSLIPSIENTEAILKIYDPNGSLWYQEADSVNIDGTIEFSEIILGNNNASAGKYSAQIIWNDHNLNASQVGIKLLEFNVIHKTSIIAIDTYFERFAGDPLLLKVKFIDSDLNTSIAFATITYNSTFGSSGTMVYHGLGEYISEIDTNSLGLGDYYFSFNASKSYYQNQSSIDLIHLKIVAQPLALEVPKTVISGSGNDYISCQVNVTGAFSGTLITEPANISTDWQNPYTVTDHNNGTYTLNFSTWDLPTQGIIETFTVSIFANKTYYGDTTNFITMTIFPVQTLIGVNSSVIELDLGESVDIKINYTVEESGLLIVGANCSVSWPSSYNVTSDVQGFVVRLNTANLSRYTYTAIITLEKPGYETAYRSITVIITRLDMKVNTIGFLDSIEAFPGDIVTIKINLTEAGTDIYIENATVFYSCNFGSEFYFGYFDYIENGIYELELKLPEGVIGNYKMILTITKEGSIYKQKEYSFNIAIIEPDLPNYLLWLIISGLLSIVSILGILSLRSYVILPHKRKKQSELLAKTQRYKDIMNIRTLLISQRASGLQIYLKDYYFTEDFQNELISGFIQAITLVGAEIMGKGKTAIKTVLESTEEFVELDFKHFNFFIYDYQELRIVFILKEKASERFKKQTAKLLIDIEEKLSEKLKGWAGGLEVFRTQLPPLLNQYFQLKYRESFKLNKAKNINRIKKEEKLSKMELRLINVITSMTKENEEFYLENVIKLIHEKNKDKVIEALESLIEREIVISF